MIYEIDPWLPAWNNSHYKMAAVIRHEVDQRYHHKCPDQDTNRYLYMIRQLHTVITGYSMDYIYRFEQLILFQSVYTCAVISQSFPNVIILFIKKNKYSFLDELLQISKDNNIGVVFADKTITFYDVPLHAYYYMISVIMRGGEPPLNIYDRRYAAKQKAIQPRRNLKYPPVVNGTDWFSILYRWYYNDIRDKFQLYFKKDIYNMNKVKTRLLVQEIREEFRDYIFKSNNHTTIRKFFEKIDVYNRYFFHVYQPRYETTSNIFGFRLPKKVLYSYLLQLKRIISSDLYDSLESLNTFVYINIPEYKRYLFKKNNKQKPLPRTHATLEDGMSNMYTNSYRVIRQTGDSLTDFYIEQALEYHFSD